MYIHVLYIIYAVTSSFLNYLFWHTCPALNKHVAPVALRMWLVPTSLLCSSRKTTLHAPWIDLNLVSFMSNIFGELEVHDLMYQRIPESSWWILFGGYRSPSTWQTSAMKVAIHLFKRDYEKITQWLTYVYDKQQLGTFTSNKSSYWLITLSST